QRVVRDSYSGVAFVKVDAANISVRSLGDDQVLSIGDHLFALDADRGVRRTEIIAFDAPPAKDANDLVRSSELLHRMILLTELDALPGTVLFTADGNIVAVVAASSGSGTSAVPLSSFLSTIGGVLKDGLVARPRLGVSYLDLSRLNHPSDGQNSRIETGALLAASPDGKKPAVAKGGPAAQAGLRAGDVITAVDGEAVSGRKLLADILSTFAPGNSLKLSVRRGSQELSLDVVLGREDGK
ncbi:MAG: PDZ domain-containing protein, partial [Patescibacteria group bacterium]